MKKNIFVLICIFIGLVIVISIGLKIGSDFNKEAILKDEIRELDSLLDDSTIDNDKINNILDRNIIKNTEYERVENGVKSYYRGLYQAIENLNFLLDEDNQIDYLSAENLKDDSTTFSKSRDNILNTKAQIEENYVVFRNYLNNEEIKLSYVEDKNLSRYYINFYLSLLDDNSKEKIVNNMFQRYQNRLNKLDIYNKALDYLVANNGEWTLKNDVITFDKVEYYEEFINITKELN